MCPIIYFEQELNNMLSSFSLYFLILDCDLKPVGKSTYQKYEKAIDAWVTEDCHVGLVFNVMLCHCVKDGVGKIMSIYLDALYFF